MEAVRRSTTFSSIPALILLNQSSAFYPFARFINLKAPSDSVCADAPCCPSRDFEGANSWWSAPSSLGACLPGYQSLTALDWSVVWLGCYSTCCLTAAGWKRTPFARHAAPDFSMINSSCGIPICSAKALRSEIGWRRCWHFVSWLLSGTALLLGRGCVEWIQIRWSFFLRTDSDSILDLNTLANCYSEDDYLEDQNLLKEGMVSYGQRLPVCSPPSTCRFRRTASYLYCD